MFTRIIPQDDHARLMEFGKNPVEIFVRNLDKEREERNLALGRAVAKDPGMLDLLARVKATDDYVTRPERHTSGKPAKAVEKPAQAVAKLPELTFKAPTAAPPPVVQEGVLVAAPVTQEAIQEEVVEEVLVAAPVVQELVAVEAPVVKTPAEVEALWKAFGKERTQYFPHLVERLKVSWSEALLLSRLLYDVHHATERGGVRRTWKQWEAVTGLSRRQQQHAWTSLEARDLVERIDGPQGPEYRALVYQDGKSRYVSYRPALLDLVDGQPRAALLLDLVLSETRWIASHAPAFDGAISHRSAEWQERLGFTRKDLDAARRTLRAQPWWVEEVHEGQRGKLTFWVDGAGLLQALQDAAEARERAQIVQVTCANRANSSKGACTNRTSSCTNRASSQAQIGAIESVQKKEEVPVQYSTQSERDAAAPRSSAAPPPQAAAPPALADTGVSRGECRGGSPHTPRTGSGCCAGTTDQAAPAPVAKRPQGASPYQYSTTARRWIVKQRGAEGHASFYHATWEQQQVDNLDWCHRHLDRFLTTLLEREPTAREQERFDSLLQREWHCGEQVMCQGRACAYCARIADLSRASLLEAVKVARQQFLQKNARSKQHWGFRWIESALERLAERKPVRMWDKDDQQRAAQEGKTVEEVAELYAVDYFDFRSRIAEGWQVEKGFNASAWTRDKAA